ncbi:Vacuolar protein sorting-associated protein 53 A [Raphanus sativus]|nr:Vacuolar protein sorting-associated protein 53 A [Raphanus sativus]
MLLDTQAMKTILLEIPSLARQTSTAASYSKFVSREMSRAEALLKVILSPIDSVADTYRALFPEGTPMEFQRILELKGLKKADQQSILDDFNKHGPGFTQASVSAAMPQPVPTPPALPLAITNPATAAGFIANSEDVLTRAAALGRGAATTGFKKFIALTEAAKDRKDGPLRRLFNA